MDAEVVQSRVKQVILSDHAADMMNKAREGREADFLKEQAAVDAANKARIARYQGFVEMRNDGIRRAKESRAATRAKKGFHPLTTLWGLLKLFAAWFPAPPTMPVLYKASLKAPDRGEAVWISGREGEKKLDTFLVQYLNARVVPHKDEWTLYSGYLSHKGEIDRILVGASGVFAFEVKDYAGVIHSNGDTWWRDKYDKYGNCVEQNLPIQDRSGRGPSLQLNNAADTVEKLIASVAPRCRVVRCVVFTHDKSRLGEIKNVTVDAVATLPLDMKALLRRGVETLLTDDEVQMICKKIQSSHIERLEKKGGSVKAA
jgi:hypothetical protein